MQIELSIKLEGAAASLVERGRGGISLEDYAVKSALLGATYLYEHTIHYAPIAGPAARLICWRLLVSAGIEEDLPQPSCGGDVIIILDVDELEYQIICHALPSQYALCKFVADCLTLTALVDAEHGDEERPGRDVALKLALPAYMSYIEVEQTVGNIRATRPAGDVLPFGIETPQPTLLPPAILMQTKKHPVVASVPPGEQLTLFGGARGDESKERADE